MPIQGKRTFRLTRFRAGRYKGGKAGEKQGIERTWVECHWPEPLAVDRTAALSVGYRLVEV